GEVLTLATHAQHLDDRGVGSVPTILGTPLGLGNPDGVTSGYRMVDVGRQGLVHRQLLPSPGHRAVHDETLVQPHQVAEDGALQQVVAEGATGGRVPGVVARVIDGGRVQGNVPVIGHEQMGLALAGVVDTVVGIAQGAFFNNLVDP